MEDDMRVIGAMFFTFYGLIMGVGLGWVLFT